MIMKSLNKKSELYMAFFMFLVYIISYYARAFNLPDSYVDLCCSDDKVLNIFFIFVPFFVITIILNFIKDKNWNSWKKFTVYFFTIYFIIYFLFPTTGDGFIWFQRETVVFFGSILYSIISLILILYKYFKKS